MKLRTILIILISISILICSAIITAMLLSNHKAMIIRSYATSTQDSLAAVDNALSSYIQTAIFSHEKYLNSDSDFLALLNRNADYSSEKEILVETYLLDSYLEEKAPYYDFTESLTMILDKNGIAFNIRNPMEYESDKLDEFISIIRNYENNDIALSEWILIDSDIFSNEGNSLVFCHIRNLYNHSSLRYSGKSVFTVSEAELLNHTKDNSLVQEGALSFTENEPGYIIDSDKNQITITIASSVLPLNLTATLSLDMINATIRTDFMKYLFIISSIILIAVLATVFMSKYITKPMYQLMAEMGKAKETHSFTHLSLESKASYDIKELFTNYNSLIDTINHLIFNEYELSKKKRQAEFDALVSQINPHFLYNTLESIIWKAKASGENDIAEMAYLLGQLFRTAVNKGLPLLPLREELKNADAYIKLQNRRYGGRLKAHISYDDATILEEPVLKLTLQPIIENAILHALPPSPEDMNIYIHAEKSSDGIFIYVEDTGAGIDSAVLENLQTRLGSTPLSYSHEEAEEKIRNGAGGVGLINVHQRIQLYYGTQYGISIESKIGEGTTITIFLPVINNDNMTAASRQIPDYP